MAPYRFPDSQLGGVNLNEKKGIIIKCSVFEANKF
jgi:hypothetical protein